MRHIVIDLLYKVLKGRITIKSALRLKKYHEEIGFFDSTLKKLKEIEDMPKHPLKRIKRKKKKKGKC